MSSICVALHGMFPAGPTDTDVAAAFDAAAAAIGLSFVNEQRSASGVDRRYADSGVEPVGFSYTLTPPCQALVSLGYYPSGREQYAPPRIAEAFTSICTALDADLGRSDLGGGYGYIQERELEGPLEFIDWYQYLGPRIVERIGRERLLASPAFKITELDRDAILMMLAAGPWDEDWSRLAVANHLGITLRPATARNPKTGEPIVINWR